MNRLYFMVLTLIASVLIVSAHESALTDAHISGHAVEKGSNEHLAFITIRLLNTTIGTTTDATGHYFLKNLP